MLESTPVMALSVLGVIVAAPGPPAALFIMFKKAAVPGEGGGNATGPPMSGVRPVPGVRPVRGVRPERKVEGSKDI